jgi:hypothetical protein
MENNISNSYENNRTNIFTLILLLLIVGFIYLQVMNSVKSDNEGTNEPEHNKALKFTTKDENKYEKETLYVPPTNKKKNKFAPTCTSDAQCPSGIICNNVGYCVPGFSEFELNQRKLVSDSMIGRGRDGDPKNTYKKLLDDR